MKLSEHCNVTRCFAGSSFVTVKPAHPSISRLGRYKNYFLPEKLAYVAIGASFYFVYYFPPTFFSNQ